MAKFPVVLKVLCSGLACSTVGCVSSIGQDGPPVSVLCQQQARDAASNPPLPKQIRNGKYHDEIEQSIRDSRMSRACQEEVDSQSRIKF